jgi:hypothetical protein
MREDHRLWVFENRVLRRTSGPKRDEIIGEWRKLHHEELNDLYFSSNIIWLIKLRRISLVGHIACMGERRGAYKVLVGKHEGKRPLGRSRCRWEDVIKVNLQEAGWGVWSGLMWFRIGAGGRHL